MDNFNQRKAEQYLNQPLPALMGELALYDIYVAVVSLLATRVLHMPLDAFCGCP